MPFLRWVAACFWGWALLVAAFQAWANAASKDRPGAVLAMAPRNIHALEQSQRDILEREIATAGFSSPSDVVLHLAANPLDEWTFIRLAVFADVERDRDEAVALMRLAYERNPRNILTIAWLAQSASSHSDGGEALMWLDRMLAVDDGLADGWIEIAAAYARQPGGQQALLDLLGSERRWAKAVVGELNKTDADLPTLLALNRLARNQQAPFLQGLLSEKGPEFAFEVWAQLADQDPEKMNWPYDPEFEGLNGPGPFNWTTLKDFAGINADEGLFVTYLGREPRVLARQLMVLRPGSYRLVVRYNGQTNETAGQLTWEVSCLDSGAKVVTIRLENQEGGDAKQSADFVIPAETCASQRIVLKGVPGQYRRGARIATRSVQIEALEQ